MKYFYNPSTTCHLCAKGHKDSRVFRNCWFFLKAIPVFATCSSSLVVWLPAASAFARLSGQNFSVSGTLCLREAEDTRAVSRELKMSTESREEEKELRSIVCLKPKLINSRFVEQQRQILWPFYLKNGGSLNTCKKLQKEIFSRRPSKYLLQSMDITCARQWRFVSV